MKFLPLLIMQLGQQMTCFGLTILSVQVFIFR